MSRTFGGSAYLEKNLPSTVTAGCVLYRFKSSQATVNAVMWGRHSSPSSQLGLMSIMNNPNAGKTSAYGKYNTSSNSFHVGGTGAGFDGQWHSGGINYTQGSGQSIELYGDGVLEASGTTVGAWSIASTLLRLGRDADGFWGGYIGEIADFAWFNARLTADEHMAFHRGFSPKRIKLRNLVCYIPLIRHYTDYMEGSMTDSGTGAGDHPRAMSL